MTGRRYGRKNLSVLVSVCLSVATISLSAAGPEFSHNRDLPPLKLLASDLDTILQKAHSFIAGKPISSVTIDLGDYTRRVSVSGEAADQVEGISNLLANDLLGQTTPIGGAMFRRVAGVCVSFALLASLIVGSVYCWKTGEYRRIRNADLFCSWHDAAFSFAVGKISSWFCVLPELFAFPSH
jgi:hypothetical protein